MHEHLPECGDSNQYPLSSPSGAEVVAPVYAQPVPNLDGYSTVCVHVREASFIASHDPIACQHASPLQALPGVTSPLSAAPPPPPPVKKKRPLLSAGQTAIWICVAQLGIIIWLLGAQSLGLDRSIDGIKKSIAALGSSSLAAIFRDEDSQQVSDSIAGARGHGKKSKPRSKGARKNEKGGLGAAFNWPVVKNFVPPPPPSLPDGKMMVPPPPVAYSLLDKAPGAAGAMTLPPPPAATLPAKPAKIAAVKKESDRADESVSPVASTAAAKEGAPLPGKAPSEEGLPQGSAAVAETEQHVTVPAVTEHASEPPSPAKPVASAPVEAPVPTVAPHPVSAAAVVHPPSPLVRTVMSGNRKRVIADR